ncbi:MAG: EthD domain-containing protein, partial [Mycobacterium sp.]
MVKLVYVIRARDDVPRAEFHRYWREQHAAKVKSVAEA